MSNDPGQPATSAPASTLSFDLGTPRVAMAIGAHPDDVEFGCGATLAKWARSGAQIHHVICTDGSKGTWDANADTVALVAARKREQNAAATVLAGVPNVHFLDHIDGELENNRELQRQIARLIRVHKPDVVLTHDPWKQYRLHPDHRNAGQAVCDAIVAARDPHFLKDLGIPHHRPNTLFMWEAQVVHHVEDVTGLVDIKLEALECHLSQFESTMKVSANSTADTSDQLRGIEVFRERIRKRLSDLGAPHGFAAAEVFSRISDL